MIDSVTPNTPALLSKWDRSTHLANGKALALAGATCSWEGVECAQGRPTGRLTTAAANRVRRAIPAKSLEQRLTESRAALAHLRALGVTTIHDNTGPEQMEVYQELKRRGELTTRIYMRPTMDKCPQLRAVGIGAASVTTGSRSAGEGLRRRHHKPSAYYEPYHQRRAWAVAHHAHRPARYGAAALCRLAGFWPQVHAIGDP